MLVLFSLGFANRLSAQDKVEVGLQADFVSQYVWRGLQLGHVSVQPDFNIGWKGLALDAWGSVGLSHATDARELDLTLSYTTGGLSVGIVDYWNNETDARYFYYKTPDTGHMMEGFLGYDFGLLSLAWNTVFAFWDSSISEDSGHRDYSTYIECSVPFRCGSFDFTGTAGIVPWKSDFYGTKGFNVVNLSLRADKEIPVTDRFSLPVFGQLTANPVSQDFYLVAGFSLKY